MSIWEYKKLARETTIQAVSQDKCIFCTNELEVLHSEASNHHKYPNRWGNAPPGKGLEYKRSEIIIKKCQMCGWWSARKDITSTQIDHGDTAATNRIFGASGCLKKLDLSDISTPSQEIRDYLIGRYKDRYHVHPKKFEDVVASVFQDLGYFAVVTNYSGDDGIDIFLNKEESIIGVQVKRHKNSIGVHQIRELAGSLLLNGVTKGIFVTTSEFQSGALNTAYRYKMKGYPIELMDSERFYKTLEIAQIKYHRKYDTWIIKKSLQNLDILKHESWRE